jgi:hypothetical protein
MALSIRSLGGAALCVSLTALLGVCLCSIPGYAGVGRLLALLGPVAIVLGVVARWRFPTRTAFWAVAVGTLASFYLPTLFAFGW